MDFIAGCVVLPQSAPRHQMGNLMICEGELNFVESRKMECGPFLKHSPLPPNRVADQLTIVCPSVVINRIPIIQITTGWNFKGRRFGRGRLRSEIYS